jgi:pimeloyl-ACP methyl ester carboxylesterase
VNGPARRPSRAAGRRPLRLLAALALVALATAVRADGGTTAERRFYVDGPWGQIHVREAAPPADTVRHPPLVLLHQTPLSGRVYATVMPALAVGRRVYALDTPGYGESDPPPSPVAIEDYAGALAAILGHVGTPVDLLGYHTGVLLATELALTRPDDVRRVVLVSVPLFDEATRAAYEPKRDVLSEDGSHLTEMWASSMKARAPGQTLEQIARIVAEKQRAGSRSWWAGPAIFGYDTASKLAELEHPTLVVRTGDSLRDNTTAAEALLPDGTLVDREQWVYGFWDADPEGVASTVLPFLDGE